MKQLDFDLINTNLRILGLGNHSCGRNKGWISIAKNKGEDSTDVMWTSDEDIHYPIFNGPAYSVDFLKDSIGFVCKSALSMHEVTKEKKKLKWAAYLSTDIENAIKYRYKMIKSRARRIAIKSFFNKFRL